MYGGVTARHVSNHQRNGVTALNIGVWRNGVIMYQ